MRRFLLIVSLAGSAAFACGELKHGAPENLAPTPGMDGSAPGDDDDVASPRMDGGPPIEEDAGPTKPRPAVCDGGCEVETLTTDFTNLGALAVDGINVYVSDPTGVYSCTKDGCGDLWILLAPKSAASIVASGGAIVWPDGTKLVACFGAGCNVAPFALIEESGPITGLTSSPGLYAWRTAGSPDRLRTCAKDSCTPALVRTVTTSAIGPGIAVSSHAIAWVDGNSFVKGCSLVRAGACDTPTVLGAGTADIAIGGPSDGTAYWASNQYIVSCDVEGCDGAPMKIAHSTEPRHTAVDANHVYWRDAIEDHIYRCPRNGCEQPEIVASNIAGPNSSFALEADYVYWTTKKGLFRRRK